MTAIGLTGGVGMGKSTAANLLRERGFPIIDSDAVAREIVEPGQPALNEIKHVFGDGVIDSDGCLRRDQLARIVFANPDSRRVLEGILHPRIRSIWQAQLETWKREGHRAGVVVIPLLFETETAGAFDSTICVACSKATQRQRLHARGWSDEEIDRRIGAQMPVEEKMLRADYVVWTEGDPEVHRRQLERIVT